MTRIKGGILHAKRRRGIAKFTKGYRWGRKSKIKAAKVAKMKAGQHAFASRRDKKHQSRGLFMLRINAALRMSGKSYSKFMGALKKQKIELDRKILAELAKDEPKIFAKICEKIGA
jgi:large subunit ribosomal protein L20